MASNTTTQRGAEARRMSQMDRRGSEVGQTPVQRRQSSMAQFGGRASSDANRSLKGPDKGRGAKG